MRRASWRALSAGMLMTVALGGVLVAQQGSPQPRQPQRVISKIRGDLYRFQHDNHNSWFLVTSDGVIVGDPISAEAATWLKNEIAQRFKVPVRYLVYSHHHFDHARGARVFDDTAELIGHATMAAAIKDAIANLQGGLVRSLDANKNGKIDRTEAQGGTAQQFDELDTNRDGALDGPEITGDVRPPESTYTDRRPITLGGKRVELIYPGPNHSVDGTVVYFPAERVIFAADWISVRATPGNVMTPPAEFVSSLKIVEALDFDLVLPGHGNIGTKADVSDYRRYFEELIDGVSTGLAAGRTVEQLQASAIGEKFSWWPGFSQGRNTNIAHVYQQLSVLRTR